MEDHLQHTATAALTSIFATEHRGHAMNERLMTDADLSDVTGLKQNAARVKWFRRHFGVNPVQRADGSIILTWAAFESMQARRAGGVAAANDAAPRPKLMPVGRAAA